MPKTNFDRINEPEIDWLRAVILERMAVKHISIKQLASGVHVHYDTMRKYMMQSPESWPCDVRAKVCTTLGIKTTRMVEIA